jgi:hypothetical protein
MALCVVLGACFDLNARGAGLSGVVDDRLGNSANRLRPLTPIAGTDFHAAHMTEWLRSQCVIHDRATAIACGERIGMSCPPASSTDALCEYRGRVFARSDRERVWRGAEYIVGMVIDESAKASLTYRVVPMDAAP